ncbi:MAG: hypothetical protein AB7U99_04870 [Steroidobacteraceae bacterium]
MTHSKWSCMAVLLCVVGIANAALLDEARVVSASKSLTTMLPAPVSFTIASAGTYTLSLADVQGQSGPGSAFSSLSVVIAQGSVPIKTLTLPSNSFTVSSTVTLAAGSYQAQVLGVTAGASQYGLNLRNTSNVSVFSDSSFITAPPTTNFSSLQQNLTLDTGASYTVTLSDRIFPLALTTLQASIVQGGNVVLCPLTAVGTVATCSFTASASANQLIVLATEASGGAGLYSVKVVNNATGAIAYSNSLPLGTMPQAKLVNFPATDSYALTSIDFLTPAALATFKLALVQDGELLVKQTVTGGPVAFSGITGTASLYVIPVAVTNSAGQYSVVVKRGSSSVFTLVDSAKNGTSSSLEGFVFNVSLPAAGNYLLQLRDFAYPDSFVTLNASASQDGVKFDTTLAAPGTMALNNAVAGELSIAVLAKPSVTGAGLFGLVMTTAGSTTSVWESNQGVGASFSSQVVTVPVAAHYLITATDFFASTSPLALNQLRVAVTRGAQLVGQIFGGGGFAFDATTGSYTLNFIATAKSSPGYGMFGASVATSPIVTLSTVVSSVMAGGTTSLSWSATDATSCSASGGWTGAQPTSGSTTVGPLTSATTFTLTCSGVGGTTVQSTAVTIQPMAASGDSGGGAISVALLLALSGLFGVRWLLAVRPC